MTKRFAGLKFELMPYLSAVGLEAHHRGIPFMRPMALQFPHDPAARYLDRQYMIGDELLVAPVFSTAGEVEYYLPSGSWTNYLTGETVQGGGWRSETHDFLSVPLWVREGAVLPIGARTDRPDYDHVDGVTIRIFDGAVGDDRDLVVGAGDDAVSFRVTRGAEALSVTSTGSASFTVRTSDGRRHPSIDGTVRISR